MKKIKEIFNLPIILFIIIIVNYIPLIFPNMMSKESIGVSTTSMMICFIIEIILLLIMLYKKVDITRESKGNLIAILLITIVLLVVQAKNFITDEFEFFDIINIDCILVNIVLLYICMINIKVQEKNIYNFFKAIILFGVISCIVNIILYWNEIGSTLGIGAYIDHPDIKSFFANRNQFAFFLFVVMIANYFIVERENKILYKISFVLFVLNLILTMSRTGILVIIIWFGLVFLITDKISIKKKMCIMLFAIILLIVALLIIANFFPNIWIIFNDKFFRLYDIKNLAGRTEIWKVGNNLLFSDIFIFLFGVGRFKSTSLLHIGSKVFTQFHNIYLDILLTGGILLLGYILFIYGAVIRKILKSNLSKNVKKIYVISFIAYGIYMCFESCGRFSIGSSDTICLIFFITIPLLHANSIKEQDKKIDDITDNKLEEKSDKENVEKINEVESKGEN